MNSKKHGVEDPRELGVEDGWLVYRRRVEDMPLATPPPNATPEQVLKIEAVRKKMLAKAQEKYLFRVRPRVAAGATPKDFSPSIQSVYVEPQLPIVRIDTEGYVPVTDKENYRRATMTIDPNGTDFAAYSGTLGIRGRGNSTWLANKKPYRLRLDTKSPLMGIASDRNWVLLANAMDRSQLRSFAASQIAQATDLAWTPSYRHVEVILNGRYDGVYQLSEHIRPGADRVAIEHETAFVARQKVHQKARESRLPAAGLSDDS